MTARGVTPLYPPTDMPWGNRDVRVTDPFGNKICIATRL